MNRRTTRAAGLAALLIGAGTLVQPVHATAAAPQNTCSGAFCVTFDLTTYEQPMAEMARTLVEMLMDRRERRSVLLPGRLIVRGST